MKKELLLIFFSLFIACSDMGTNPREEEIIDLVSYENNIQPLFKTSCVNCHGNQGQLSLVNYKSLMQGGESGKVVIPNNSSGSLLIKKLKGETLAQRMPPPPQSPLDKSKIDMIAKWIDLGAEEN